VAETIFKPGVSRRNAVAVFTPVDNVTETQRSARLHHIGIGRRQAGELLLNPTATTNPTTGNP
jgi:hypothetical protein